MQKKKQKISVAEKVTKVVDKQQKTAGEIRQELKDRFGYSIEPRDIRVNLLYLLRRGKIQRKKEGKIYRYFI